MLSFFAIIPLVVAVVIYILPLEKIGRIIAVAVQATLTCCAFYLVFMCKQGEVVSTIGNYIGVMGIILKADSLSAVFTLLASFIFLVVAIYSFNDSTGRLFWFLLFIWQGLLNGLFLTRDFFNVFVLVEAVTVVAAVMIMFNRDDRSIYDGMVYLMVNTVAVQFYLFGTGYIYKLTGVLDMDAAVVALGTLDKSSLILPFALIMTAVCLKCALVPLFSWMPKAYRSPGALPAVTAILSGLHIKSALYLFIRLEGVFRAINVPAFFLVIGFITGITGFILALSQTDIYLILAYSTISQIGMIMIGLHIGYVNSYIGSLYHIMNHSLCKTPLFLISGIIVYGYGTRDIREIRGVFRRNRLIGAAAVTAILGITGAPFFNGSISKYFIMSGANWLVRAPIILINLGTITVFFKFSSILFGFPGPNRGAIKIDGLKYMAILVLGILCLAGGVFAEQFIGFLLHTSVHVDLMGYVEKIILFVLSGIAGYLISKYYLHRSKLLPRIKGKAIGFKGICALMGVFFAILLIVGYLSSQLTSNPQPQKSLSWKQGEVRKCTNGTGRCKKSQTKLTDASSTGMTTGLRCG